MALKWPPMVLVAHAALGGAWVGAAAPKNKWRGGVGPSRRTLAAAPCALQPGNGFHSPSVSKIYRRLRIHGSRCREGLGGAESWARGCCRQPRGEDPRGGCRLRKS